MSYQKDLGKFTRRPYRSRRLKKYYADMGKDKTKVLYDDQVADMLHAQGYHCEESPRSIYSVDKLFEALSHYAPGKVPDPEPGIDYQHGISLAYSAFARGKDVPVLHVLPFTPETICLVTSNPGGSAGLTHYGFVKAQSQQRALERGLQTLHGEKQPEPCIAFKRTQFNYKTRLVWGYPYSMTAIEGLIAYSLNELFKGGTTPMAYAMASGALGTKMRVASYHREYCYSLDMSQFDASLSANIIHIAFDILRTWYDLDEVEPISGCTVRQIFNLVEYFFIHTTIVMPDGNIYIGKDHGVPSGSYFTQMIDSIANVIICGTISYKFNLHVSKREVFVLGDDLSFWSNRAVSLDDIAKFASHRLGVKVHGSEKSEIVRYDQPIHYLGRDWTNGLPDLSTDEVVKRMIYPESFRRRSSDPTIREKEVKMMLLSFAANYRSAWKIAYDLLDGSGRNINRGCANLDVNVFDRGPIVPVNPDHLSGLMRYQIRYLRNGAGKAPPNTALLYWL